ncbi:MAG: hypothetical protein HKN16_06240 [Saprospiraceae bacterium]|nr:hypothetical protein [Saprospiraceae bacterium]
MRTSIHLVLFFFCISLCAQDYEIYVSDAGNFNNPPWKIIKYDGDGLNPTTFINTNLNWPQDILFMENEDVVLISNLGSGQINRHDASNGVYQSNFASGIGGPTRMKIGPDSLLYVLQWSGNGKVKRYELNGTFVDDFTSEGVTQSIGIDWDEDGNLYVSSYGGGIVRKFDSDGNDMGLFINSDLQGPTNIWFNDAGNLLVADYNGTSIKRFSFSGNFLGNFISGLSNCEGVDHFPNGNILIGNGGTKSVKLYDSSGNYLEDIIESGSGGLLTPNAVVIREVTSTSTEELESESTSIIYPSHGNSFFLNDVYLGKVSGIQIYNLAGEHVGHRVPEGSKAWTPKNLPTGYYLLKCQFKTGQIKTEKILLQTQ